MSSDLLCPSADFLYFFGSDCFITKPLHPSLYFVDGKPLMLFNSYQHLLNGGANVKDWWEGTSAAMGFNVEYEFMRRLPLVYPARVLKGTRDHLEKIHEDPFDLYVYSTVPEDGEQYHSKFSESNVIGSYAYYYDNGAYNWVNMDTPHVLPENPLIQFWSHGGIDRPNDHDQRTPRSVFEEVLGQEVVNEIACK
jgi:hypothetical protein